MNTGIKKVATLEELRLLAINADLLAALQEMLATAAGQYDSARHCRAIDAARAAIAKATQP